MRGDIANGCLLAAALLAAPQPFLHASTEFVPCKNHYSPEEQIQLGDKAKAQVYKTTPVLPDSSAATRYITALGQKLVAQAPGYKWPYDFHVANVAEVNAFALPGGTVFVNLGSIQAAQTEAQLAGVMAHEISHVVLQHSVCNAEKAQKVGILSGLGQIAAGVLIGGAAGDLAQEGIGLTAGLGFLKMSREAERQADLEGVGIAYDAGYDPHGLPQFFQIIEARSGGGSQFLSDHPNPGNRTLYLDREIASYPPRPNWTTNTPAFSRMKKEVASMRAYTAKEVSSGVWKARDPDTSGTWKLIRGGGFSIEVPANWETYTGRTSQMLGPPGGVVRSAGGDAAGVVYGVLSDVFQPPPGVRGPAALDELVSQIARDNPGFRAGGQSEITPNGIHARTVECENPSANRGDGEHDWIVAYQHADGSLRYFVFVAPSPEFEKLRPTFEQILGSLRLR